MKPSRINVYVYVYQIPIICLIKCLCVTYFFILIDYIRMTQTRNKIYYYLISILNLLRDHDFFFMLDIKFSLFKFNIFLALRNQWL